MLTCNDCIHSIICDRDIRDTGCTCSAFLEDRPHGKWEKDIVQVDERHFRSFARCTNCACSFKPYSFAVKEFDFCPKCGSDNRPREGEAE